jgi:hypothetical protein
MSGTICFDRAFETTEIKMREAALTILGALLIAGSAAQIATASEQHTHKVDRTPVATTE